MTIHQVFYQDGNVVIELRAQDEVENAFLSTLADRKSWTDSVIHLDDELTEIKAHVGFSVLPVYIKVK